MKPITFTVVDWRTASEFIRLHHRHHAPPQGWKLGIGAYHRDRLVGVAVIGRPVSRVLQARGYLEVTRTCTIVWGVNRELYRRCAQFGVICTYTTDGESGKSLTEAGWAPVAHRDGRQSDWNSANRKRTAKPAGRTRWEPVR